MSLEVISFFEKARKHVIEQGFQWEIDLVENRHLVDIDAWHLFEAFLFVVLGSSGLNNKVVKKYYDLFASTCEKQGAEEAFKTIPNRRIREVARYVWLCREEILATLFTRNSDERRIEYIRTFPQMGKKTAKHFARNIGIDCVKPDLWMLRIAEQHGFFTADKHEPDPDATCRYIQNYLPCPGIPSYRIGTIDVILWRYCVLTGKVE